MANSKSVIFFCLSRLWFCAC